MKILNCVLIFLVLAISYGCGSEVRHPYKNSEAVEANRQKLEKAKEKTAAQRQKLAEAQKKLEEAKRNISGTFEREQQKLSDMLEAYERDLKVSTIETIVKWIDIIEQNLWKSKAEILAYWRHHKESRSNILDVYFSGNQKPTNAVLERLSQEELSKIKNDLEACVDFIFSGAA